MKIFKRKKYRYFIVMVQIMPSEQSNETLVSLYIKTRRRFFNREHIVSDYPNSIIVNWKELSEKDVRDFLMPIEEWKNTIANENTI